MIVRGGSPEEVREFPGHKTMTVTLRYARRSQEPKKKAVNLLNGLTASDEPAHSAYHESVTNSLCPLLAIG